MEEGQKAQKPKRNRRPKKDSDADYFEKRKQEREQFEGQTENRKLEKFYGSNANQGFQGG